jgi:hypothetical protein
VSASRDSEQSPVKHRGQEIGRVWRVEPRQWAFKFTDGLLIRGFRSTKAKARTALIEQWKAKRMTP